MSVSSALQDLSLGEMQFSKGNEPKWSETKYRVSLEGGGRQVTGLEGVNLNATNDESNGRLNDDGEQLRTRRSQEGAAGSRDSPPGAAETKSELI